MGIIGIGKKVLVCAQVWNDKANNATLLLGKRSGKGIRLLVGFFDYGEDSLPGHRGNLVVVTINDI